MKTERMIIFILMILLFASLLFLKIETDKRDKRDKIIESQTETIMKLTSSFVEYEADKELIKDLRLGKYEK